MPSHQERIHKVYEGLCIKCLKRLNMDWDDENSYPNLCNICKCFKYLERKMIYTLPNSIIHQLSQEETTRMYLIMERNQNDHLHVL